jgi:hypothetical protein
MENAMGLAALAQRTFSLASCLMLLIGLLSAILVDVAEAKTIQSGRIGAPYSLVLEGNPFSGHSWRLDEKASQGVDDIVQVRGRGYKSGPLGGNAPYIFEITCMKIGFARLFFTYRSINWIPSTVQDASHEHLAICIDR